MRQLVMSRTFRWRLASDRSKHPEISNRLFPEPLACTAILWVHRVELIVGTTQHMFRALTPTVCGNPGINSALQVLVIFKFVEETPVIHIAAEVVVLLWGINAGVWRYGHPELQAALPRVYALSSG